MISNPTTSFSTVTFVAQSESVMGLGFGAGTILPKELAVRANGPDLNVLALQNLHPAGWSAMTFRDSQGYERGAIGFGNGSTLLGAGYRGQVYLELSNLGDPIADAGGWVVSQYTSYGGTVPHTWHHRLELDAAGYWIWYPMDDNGGSGHARELMRLDRQMPVLRIGNSTGTYGYGEVQGADQNWAIVLRDKGDGATSNGYYAYGGTLAEGGGHRFFTGGLRGDQAVRWHVANDGVAAHVPLVLTPQAQPSAAAPGTLYADAGDGHLYFRSGGSWVRLDN